MTNIYQTGTFINEQDLWIKLNPLILNAGWSIQSSITDGYDRVYFSTGEDGYAINYIRMVARLQDEVREDFGSKQRLNTDGYSGFVNFLAYQYFPPSGVPTDGYGLIGQFGPTMYFSDNADIRRIDLITAGPTSQTVTDLIGNASSWPASDGPDFDSNCGKSAFDGHKFIYFTSTSGNLYRYNVSTGFTSASLAAPINKFAFSGMTYIATRDRYYLVAPTTVGTPGFQVVLFEFNFNDQLLNTRFIQNPPWNNESRIPLTVGYDKYLYIFRGSNTTPAFARYDVTADTWLSLTTTNVPTLFSGTQMILTTRQQTGRSKHRLYLIPGNGSSALRYLNVEDNGDILDASWTSVSSTPFAQANNNTSLFEWDGYDRILYNPAENGSTGKELYRYSIGLDTWTLVNSNFFPNAINDVADMHLHSAYQSRVKADYYKLNQRYWFFGDKDRFIVVTKDFNGFYTYCYAGAIESYYSNVTKATTTTSISAGLNVVIPVTNTTLFSIGEKIQIQGSSTDIFTNTGLDAKVRKFIKTEHITIEAITPGVSITAFVLNNTYSSGARLAQDIQNTVVTVEGTRWAQALNKPNTSNSYASGDTPEQYYVLQPAISTTYSNLTDLNKRTNQFTLWPYVLASENVTNFSGKEVRGQLKGVFSAGTGTGTSEDIIEINGSQYIIFSIARQEDTRFYVFGPIV